MKNIAVALRLSKKAHPLYEELVNYPPVRVVFNGGRKSRIDTSNNSFVRVIKNRIWRKFNRVFPSFLPYKTSEPIIHSTNNILPLTHKPFVLDTESEFGLFGFRYTKYRNPTYRFLIKKYLGLSQCKRIIAWSKICMSRLEGLLGKKLAKKIVMIYPAHHVPLPYQKKRSSTIRLLFVSRTFEFKGGYELLDAFNLIRDKYDCSLTIISDIPEEVKKKYAHDKRIRLIQANLDRESLAGCFRDADMFVYPSRIDSFGFVLVEAMAHKLPIVSTRVYAIPEIVEESKCGILVDPIMPWVEKEHWRDDYDYLREYQQAYLRDKGKFALRFASAMETLLQSSSLRKKFGMAGFREVRDGKFSIKERNKKLKQVYIEALR